MKHPVYLNSVPNAHIFRIKYNCLLCLLHIHLAFTHWISTVYIIIDKNILIQNFVYRKSENFGDGDERCYIPVRTLLANHWSWNKLFQYQLLCVWQLLKPKKPTSCLQSNLFYFIIWSNKIKCDHFKRNIKWVKHQLICMSKVRNMPSLYK